MFGGLNEKLKGLRRWRCLLPLSFILCLREVCLKSDGEIIAKYSYLLYSVFLSNFLFSLLVFILIFSLVFNFEGLIKKSKSEQI